MMKVCKKCGLDKPLSEFSKSGFRNGKQVYKSRCKNCLSKLSNIYPVDTIFNFDQFSLKQFIEFRISFFT